MSKRSEKITFRGSSGENLAARLDLPSGAPVGYALFAHCFTCSKDIFAASRIAGRLSDHGIAVLRFDFTGIGASEGEFANTNFSSNVDDLVAAAEFMARDYEPPKIIIGHSLGGAAVLSAAARLPEIDAVCTIGAPADPGHITHLFSDSVEAIREHGEVEVQLAGRPFRIQQQFLDDIAGQKLEEGIGKLGKALLIFHSPVDATVGIENAQRLYIAAKHPKSFVSLDDADHLLSRHEDAIYVADIIAAWAARYTGARPQEDEKSALRAETGTVVVQETGQGTFANIVSIGGEHQLLADEPVTYGGTDTGPSPYDFLLTALGACKSMTMRMYAERKGIAMDRCRVTLRHEKIHAEDCAECEAKTGVIDDISIDIEITGEMDDETRQRVAEIADKCPVHRTLHSEVRINSRLKP